MDLFEDLDRENKKTEEEIRKAEMRGEIGNLTEEINRTGRDISRGLQHEGGKPHESGDDTE
ncbi:hypothetical protein [uncultured Methanoregula sp.]|uniref:hypothetical protein n=1 Tax=uncultured Methanoregula sp. TaxID=1005933 RepID=UPI002AAB8306|nr:hypothetical protein [uncultured Methanoregula sp.]